MHQRPFTYLHYSIYLWQVITNKVNYSSHVNISLFGKNNIAQNGNDDDNDDGATNDDKI